MEVILKQRADGSWVIEQAATLLSIVWNRASRAGLGGWVRSHSRGASKFSLANAKKLCEEKGFEILEEIPNKKYLESARD